MNKARLLKSTLCMATALTVAMSAKTLPAKAAENDANNSLAGISLSFDSYYTVAVEDELDILAASLRTFTRDGKSSSEYGRSGGSGNGSGGN